MRVTGRHVAAAVPWVTRIEARRLLGEALILRVSPEIITGYVGPGRPLTDPIAAFLGLRQEGVVGPLGRKVLAAAHPQILPSGLFPSVAPVEQHVTYRRMREFIAAGNNWRDTSWYRACLAELQRNGAVRHKKHHLRSVEELDRFFAEEMLGMIHSLRANGYRQELADDLGTGMIDAGGRVLQSGKGRHRFAAARELGVRIVPISIVGIDRAWIRAIGGGIRSRSRREVLREHLRRVELEHRSSESA